MIMKPKYLGDNPAQGIASILSTTTSLVSALNTPEGDPCDPPVSQACGLQIPASAPECSLFGVFKNGKCVQLPPGQCGPMPQPWMDADNPAIAKWDKCNQRRAATSIFPLFNKKYLLPAGILLGVTLLVVGKSLLAKKKAARR